MSLFFVSTIMHIFLKVYLSFRSTGKILNYTHFHVNKNNELLVLKITGSTDPCL